jgi:hypothetical protein
MRRTFSLTALLFLLAASMSLHADTFLKYKKTTDSYTVGENTVPADTAIATAWIGGKQACFDDGEGHRSILTFASKILTILDLQDKTYATVKLDSIQSMINSAIDENAEDAASAAAMKSMMQGMMGAMMKGSMTVNKTAEQQKIGAWQCTKYLVDIKVVMGSTSSEMWLTDQIKIDPASFNMMKNGLMALLPGFSDIKKEFEKIKGIPVKTISKAQAMNTTVKSTELLLENTEKAAPQGIYSIPKGFKEKSVGSE